MSVPHPMVHVLMDVASLSYSRTVQRHPRLPGERGFCCEQQHHDLSVYPFSLARNNIGNEGKQYKGIEYRGPSVSYSMSSRLVPGWENPYEGTLSNHHRDQAAINYRKVMARKAEKLFSLQMKSNGSLEHLEAIKQHLASQDRTVVVEEKKRKAMVLKPTAVQPLRLRPTHSIAGPVRTIEITQGGATTWTAENDGGISVRGGASGTVVVSIPPRDDASTVDVLHATETHMWAGLSNGTVVVFDHLVFVQVTEGSFHTGSVTGFAELADGRMLSASEDGSLIKWDNESKNFEAITRIVPQDLGPISAVCARGLVAFCGSTTAVLVSLDATDKGGVQLCGFEGHRGAITAVACVDEYLFSAAMDNTVRIWNVQSGAALKVTATDGQPCVLLPVPAAHRMWVGFTTGVLQVWCTLPDDGFSIERTVRVLEGRPLVTAKSMTAVETLKVWTLASDGVNKVWSSTYNRAEEGLRSNIEALRAVITQDTIELDKWRALVLRLEHVEARRKLQLSATLSSYHRDVVLRRMMWTWMRWLKMQQERRRRQLVSERLAKETQCTFARGLFAMWYTWYRAAQRHTLKERFANASAAVHAANLQGTYAMKAIFVSRQEKTAVIKHQLVGAIYTLGQHNFQHSVFRKWMRFTKLRQDAAILTRNAKALQWFNDKLVLRRYMSQWMRVEEKLTKRRHQRDIAEKFLRVQQLRTAQSSLTQWSAFYHSRCRAKEHATLAVMLSHTNRLQMLQETYTKWLGARQQTQLRRVQDSNEQLQSKLATIRKRYSDLSTLLEEKRKITALRKKGEEDEAQLLKATNRVRALERERIRLQEVLAKKELEEEAPGESIQEQLEHVMSQLKASVINYYSDCALFHQAKEKIRAGQPVTKLFLEAHQTVKRIVVEVTRNPHLSAFERWPLSPELLQRIPSHHLNAVLGAIKTMIVTFDIMDKKDHDQLTSDQEIVLNAQWLMLMAGIAVAHKKKLTAVRR